MGTNRQPKQTNKAKRLVSTADFFRTTKACRIESQIRNVDWLLHERLRSKDPGNSSGFTLIELVVTLAVLSALTTIATVGFSGRGGIVGQINLSQIDEAKALLNAAAADCLQKSRLNNEDKDIVDDTIIADKRVNPIGFAIDKANDADKCSYFQLVPTNEKDDVRFPIGFSVSDGALSKFANPTTDNPGSLASCERWAGVNCKQDESLKRLIAWKKDIAAKKAVCEANYTKWLTVDNTTPYKFERWNPNAETGCPKRPPKNGSESYRSDPYCTPNGCNRDVYGIDGVLCGYTPEDYEECLNSKYGKVCVEWVAEKEQQEYTNNTTTLLPIRKTPECGEREFWFFKGEDKGTKEEFINTACNAWVDEKKTQNYTNKPSNLPAKTKVCGDKEYWFLDGVDQQSKVGLEEAICKSAHEQWRTNGINKRYDPIGGPGVCGEEIYVCNKSIVKDSSYYATEGCGKAPNVCSCFDGYKNEKCKIHETSTYMRSQCPVRPKQGQKREPGKCSYVGGGKPSNKVGGWLSSDECSSWAQCMGYLYTGLKCQDNPRF